MLQQYRHVFIVKHLHYLPSPDCNFPACPAPFWEERTGDGGGKIASLEPKGVLQSLSLEPGLLLTPCVPHLSVPHCGLPVAVSSDGGEELLLFRANTRWRTRRWWGCPQGLPQAETGFLCWEPDKIHLPGSAPGRWDVPVWG